MQCPRCENEILDEKQRDGVTIDTCPDCRGIWLDRGELERILSRIASEFDAERARHPPSRPRDRDDDSWDGDDHDALRRGDRHPERKRGFLSTLTELFD